MERLERRAADIEKEVADIVAASAEDNGAREAIKRDIVELHREHLDAFAEHAEKRVAEVQRLGEDLATLLDAYNGAWEAAAEAWAEPAADNGLAPVARCPVPTGAAVRGMVPRPEGIRPDEAEAA